MPLTERLFTGGIGDLFASILKQRELTRLAAVVENSGLRPPEIRIGALSQNRRLTIEFTN